jgi:hypothetical protein
VTNNPEQTYRKSLQVTSQGVRHSGFAVLEKSERYVLHFETEREPDLVRLSTCHRDVVLREELDESFSYVYQPSKGIEDKGSCILQIATFDDKGHHEFGAVDFVDDEDLMADVFCNGEQKQGISGASVCQARVGTMQVISFAFPVEVFSKEECKTPVSKDKQLFTYSVKEGYCIFLFSSEDGQLHRHTTFGYNGIMKK